MGARVLIGTCQACGAYLNNTVVLDNGEQFCPNCLVARVHDGTMLVLRSNDPITKCQYCGDGIRVGDEVTCQRCDNCENCGEPASYCESCYYDRGSNTCEDCEDCDATLCEHCSESRAENGTEECMECGTVTYGPELQKFCISCFNEIHAECGMGLSSPIVTEEGNAAFTDMEIVW